MDHADEFPVKKMSKVLGVGRSSYYNWLKNKDSYAKKEEVLNTQIQTVFARSRFTYGSPRVHQKLQGMNINISESTVARRMKNMGITPKLKKKFKNTTDSNHNLQVSPNLLNREFNDI